MVFEMANCVLLVKFLGDAHCIHRCIQEQSRVRRETIGIYRANDVFYCVRRKRRTDYFIHCNTTVGQSCVRLIEVGEGGRGEGAGTCRLS